MLLAMKSFTLSEGPSESTVDEEPEPVIFGAYLTYLWLFGLYPPQPPLRQTASSFFDWYRFKCLYSYVATFLAVGLVIIGAVDTIEIYRTQIVTLDFFVLIATINNLNTFIEVPLIYLIVYRNQTSVINLVREFERILSDMLSRNEIKVIRRRCGIYVCAWLCFWFVVSCVMMFKYYWPMLTGQDMGFHSAYTQFFAIPDVPSYIGLILHFFRWNISYLNVDLGTQMFYIMLVFWLSFAFKKVYSNSLTIYKADVNSKAALQFMKEAGRNLANLRFLTKDFNDVFGTLILVNCVRDVIALVSLISLLLDPEEHWENETTETFVYRRTVRKLQDQWDYCYTSITLAQTVLRIAVCLYCQRQVQKTSRVLKKTEIATSNPEVRNTCVNILEKLDENTGVVSAAGVAYLDRPYVANLFGVLLTYVVLVYQIRDGKMVDAEKTSLPELQPKFQRIRLAIQNLSDLITSTCHVI